MFSTNNSFTIFYFKNKVIVVLVAKERCLPVSNGFTIKRHLFEQFFCCLISAFANFVLSVIFLVGIASIVH